MAKGKKYTPKPYESSRPNKDSFTSIYESMLKSFAWKELTSNQKILYIEMKRSRYGKNKPSNYGEEYFYFNRHYYVEELGLYSNTSQFRKDRDTLIEKGFIICEENGANTRKKSVYKLSPMWQHYGTTLFKLSKKDMSKSMLNHQ